MGRMNKINAIYVADDGTDIACRNISANSLHFGFTQDLAKLIAARPKPKGKRLERRGVWAEARHTYATGQTKVIRHFFPVGDINAAIYKSGGTITKNMMIEGKTTPLTFTVVSAVGESRKYVRDGDPGGSAPAPLVSSP